MKTVRIAMPYQKAMAILRGLEELGYEFHEIPGVLIDNYICNLGTDHGLKFGRYKFRKYVLIKETYINEWRSGCHLILTDDDKTYEVWEKWHQEYLDEMESA